MNAVKSTWRQLVRRRLWPVAVLLVAALAAVPVVLAREPEAPVPPVVPAEDVTTKADDAIAEPVVAAVVPEDRSRRRRLLGSRKDPFAPAPPKKAKKAQAADPAPEREAPEQPSDSGPPPADTGADIGGGGVTSPTPAEPAPEPKTYSAGTIIVRFGDANSDQSAKLAVKKFEPVPDEELPLLIYMGLTKDGKRAKFLVDASVEVDGDGTCRPHRSLCETVELAVGETEFLDVIESESDEDAEGDEGSQDGEDTEAEDRIVAQFQLDLVDIKRKGDADVR
jgi:hypothetical protein